MSSLRRLHRQISKTKEEIRRRGTPIVWAKMIYVCEDCKARYDMYLENTLERHNGKNHKPVPFGIRCKYCGGFHCFDRSGLIKLHEERFLADGENYFKDDPHHDCGMPVYR